MAMSSEKEAMGPGRWPSGSKHLLHKHKDRGLNLQYPYKKLGIAIAAREGGAEEVGCWGVLEASPGSVRDPV